MPNRGSVPARELHDLFLTTNDLNSPCDTSLTCSPAFQALWQIPITIFVACLFPLLPHREQCRCIGFPVVTLGIATLFGFWCPFKFQECCDIPDGFTDLPVGDRNIAVWGGTIPAITGGWGGAGLGYNWAPKSINYGVMHVEVNHFKELWEC